MNETLMLVSVIAIIAFVCLLEVIRNRRISIAHVAAGEKTLRSIIVHPGSLEEHLANEIDSVRLVGGHLHLTTNCTDEIRLEVVFADGKGRGYDLVVAGLSEFMTPARQAYANLRTYKRFAGVWI